MCRFIAIAIAAIASASPKFAVVAIGELLLLLVFVFFFVFCGCVWVSGTLCDRPRLEARTASIHRRRGEGISLFDLHKLWNSHDDASAEWVEMGQPPVPPCWHSASLPLAAGWLEIGIAKVSNTNGRRRPSLCNRLWRGRRCQEGGGGGDTHKSAGKQTRRVT